MLILQTHISEIDWPIQTHLDLIKLLPINYYKKYPNTFIDLCRRFDFLIKYGSFDWFSNIDIIFVSVMRELVKSQVSYVCPCPTIKV